MPYPDSSRRLKLTTTQLAVILTAIDSLRELRVRLQLAQQRIEEAIGPHLPELRALAASVCQAEQHNQRQRRALDVLLDRSRPEIERRDAVRELAALHRLGPYEFFSPKLANPAAWRAWRSYAQEQRVQQRTCAAAGPTATEWLHEIIMLGVLRAAEDVDRPQFVRLGGSWVTDEHGRKQQVTPRSLDQDDLVLHLRARAYRHATEAVGSVPCERRASWFSPDMFDRLADAGRAGTVTLEIGPEAQRAARFLETSGVTLSLQQRRVLEFTARGYSTRDIAESLGLADDTVRVHRYRAYQKNPAPRVNG